MAQKIANPLDGNLHRKTLIVPTEFPEWFKLARPDSILDRVEVAKLFEIHPGTLFEWVRRQDFPKPGLVGPKSGWRKSTIMCEIRRRKNAVATEVVGDTFVLRQSREAFFQGVQR